MSTRNPHQLKRGVYWFLIISTILGILMPSATIVLKWSANDFEQWHAFKEDHPKVTDFVKAYPAFDLHKSLPVLSSLSWHRPRRDHTEYYVRYSLFNLIVLVCLLALRTKVRSVIDRACVWVLRLDHQFARRLIFCSILFMWFCVQTKAHFGFWFHGIGGWTFRDHRSMMRDTAPQWIEARELVMARDATYLQGALQKENAQYVSKSGFVTGRGLFLHFKDGAVLPANAELTGFVFPEIVFGNFKDIALDPHVYTQIIKHSLTQRRQNRKFALPLQIAYPNHMPYAAIDYTSYPPAEELEGISGWILSVFITPEQELKLVGAQVKYKVTV